VCAARVIVAVVVLGSLGASGACWRGPVPEDPPPEGSAAPAATDDTPRVRDAADARCTSPRGEKLASYYSVDPRGTYWIDMYNDGAGWQPIEMIPMPAHHATRLELTNAHHFRGLRRGGATARARFVIQIQSRKIQPATAGRPWRTTYRARILDACALRSRL
jgi:hypothetical protein